MHGIGENEAKLTRRQGRPEVADDDLNETINLEVLQIGPELTNNTIRMPHDRFDLVFKQLAGQIPMLISDSGG